MIKPPFNRMATGVPKLPGQPTAYGEPFAEQNPNAPVSAPGPGLIDYSTTNLDHGMTGAGNRAPNGNRRDGGWDQSRRARNGQNTLLAPRGAGGDGYYPVLRNDNENSRQDPTIPASPPSMTATPTPTAPVRRGFEYNASSSRGGNAALSLQEVDPNQLMSHQMDRLLDEDSLYMRRARQLGIDHASSRGLGNSSIAAGNAMGSAMDRAAPIAAFDAGRYGQVGDLNQAATNNMNQFNAAQDLAWSQFAHGQQMDQWNAHRGDRALDAQIYGGMFQNYWNSLGEIYNNPDLSPEEQTAAAENLGQMFPGFSEQAWQAIPPGLLAGNSVPAAQMLPPMQGVLPGYMGGGSTPPPTGPGSTQP